MQAEKNHLFFSKSFLDFLLGITFSKNKRNLYRAR